MAGAQESTLVPLAIVDQRTWERQEAFLKGFVEFGTVLKAAEFAGIDRDITYIWEREDKLGFHDRYQNARYDWRESLEEEARSRIKNPTGNRGSDILLMGMLNANWPEKWNRNLQVTHDVPSEVLKSLQALQKMDVETRAQLPETGPEKIVEGKGKVLPWEE